MGALHNYRVLSNAIIILFINIPKERLSGNRWGKQQKRNDFWRVKPNQQPIYNLAPHRFPYRRWPLNTME